MPVYCPDDDTEHPDRANFCMECGRPLYERYGLDDDGDEEESATTAPASGRARRLRGRGRVQAPAPPQRPLRWEYKDVQIALDFDARPLSNPQHDRQVAQKIDRIVLGRLQREGEAGWQADGPTDAALLAVAGRVESRLVGLWFLGTERTRYDLVTIRLKRLAPA